MDGRSYRLRTRHLPPEGKPTARARNAGRGRGRDGRNALVAVSAEPSVIEREIGPEEVLGWAWAARQGGISPGGDASARVVSGHAEGTAAEILRERRRVRWLPDAAELVEALQVEGREIREAFVPRALTTSRPTDHDCDCTCEEVDGHMRWAIAESTWGRPEVGDVLRRVAGGERVRVRLAP